MNFKLNYNEVKDKGIVYVLQLDMEDKQLVKIGITTRKVEDRVSDILVAIWKRYKIFPRCYVARYSKIDNYLGMEAFLHEYFKEFKYECEYKWGGSTEMFLLDIETVKSKYDEVKNEFCNKDKPAAE